MKRASRRAASLAVALGLAAGWGCGEGAPSVETSTAEAAVKGKVTFNGKPVTKGEVVFDPSNHLRKNVESRKAELGADGTYSATTLVGENQVYVNSPQLRKTAVEPIALDVKSGENTLDVTLPIAQ